jgi:hypothetical protein
MIKFATPLNIDDSISYHNAKNDDKKYYLSTIRELANKGNYFSLIKFIENSTPNVSFNNNYN